MPYTRSKSSFDVSGAKNFSPADFIYKLEDTIPPLTKNTEYENSVGILRDVKSGLRFRRLVELDMFPPINLSIENYALGRKSLCGDCMSQNGKCGEGKYISTNAGYRQNAKDCLQKVDAGNGLSLCPRSVLNIRWEHWKAIASVLDISYVDAVPEIKMVGDTLKDNIISNYGIQPRPAE